MNGGNFDPKFFLFFLTRPSRLAVFLAQRCYEIGQPSVLVNIDSVRITDSRCFILAGLEDWGHQWSL